MRRVRRLHHWRSVPFLRSTCDVPARSRSGSPVGVAGMITAWNANALFICLKLASAVAAGCTVVIKPSELAYCLAHHVTVNGEKRRLMVASLRYDDTFVKKDGSWLFAERKLYVDWVTSPHCHELDEPETSCHRGADRQGWRLCPPLCA